jgi:hypothetical protein
MGYGLERRAKVRVTVLDEECFIEKRKSAPNGSSCSCRSFSIVRVANTNAEAATIPDEGLNLLAEVSDTQHNATDSLRR